MAAPTTVSAHGPILSVGGGVAIDCRFIDRIELAQRFIDSAGPRLLITLEATEITLEVPGVADAEDLIVGIAPYTRAAPITNDVDYADVEDLRDSIYEGRYETPPVVVVGDEPVIVEGGLLSVGLLGWICDDVLAAAHRGESLELSSGATVSAAILSLAVTASTPPDADRLEQRMAEYRERYRTRSPS